jgi:hypothetical protein
VRLTAEDDYADMFTGLAHPSRAGRKVTSGTRAHGSDEDPTEEDQPARGGEVHGKVREVIERNSHLFSDGRGHESERTGKRTGEADVISATPRSGPDGVHTNGGGWADSR